MPKLSKNGGWSYAKLKIFENPAISTFVMILPFPYASRQGSTEKAGS